MSGEKMEKDRRSDGVMAWGLHRIVEVPGRGEEERREIRGSSRWHYSYTMKRECVRE